MVNTITEENKEVVQTTLRTEDIVQKSDTFK